MFETAILYKIREMMIAYLLKRDYVAAYSHSDSLKDGHLTIEHRFAGAIVSLCGPEKVGIQSARELAEMFYTRVTLDMDDLSHIDYVYKRMYSKYVFKYSA